MDNPNDIAGPVIARFPEQEASIQRLIEQNREFREMCLDYVEAGQALTYWRALSDTPEGKTVPTSRKEPEQVVDQYRVLLYQLEAEILEALVRDVERPDCDSA
jgi:hypothetical protein